MWRKGSSKKKTTREATGEEAAGGSSQSQPYHECPFCKHGFTTGQALGGHMNVHRRDRDRAARRPARDAPAADTASTVAYQYPPPPMMMGSGFATYYDPGAASVAWDATSYGGAGQTELNLFSAPATHGHDHQHFGVGSRVPGERGQPADGEAERSLDLELRLGRYPGWQ
ncbi:hypothetical protein QOZ80_3AG0233820 [Eleusine coracana subsp. coracana]|nr:hypothetical protein QOZ80_3AG0233820 [Eleusine coracana subsp. coracana]